MRTSFLLSSVKRFNLIVLVLIASSFFYSCSSKEKKRSLMLSQISQMDLDQKSKTSANQVILSESNENTVENEIISTALKSPDDAKTANEMIKQKIKKEDLAYIANTNGKVYKNKNPVNSIASSKNGDSNNRVIPNSTTANRATPNSGHSKSVKTKNELPLAALPLIATDESFENDMRLFLKGFPSHRLTKNDVTRNLDSFKIKLSKVVNSDSSSYKLIEYTVKPDETLMSISNKLYNTHRRWLEIYLLNSDKIKNWDAIDTNLVLQVVEPK